MTNDVEDWLKIDSALIKHFNYKPWELEELTLTEIFVLFQTLAPAAEPALSDAAAHLKAYATLTPAEKLDILF